MDEEIRKKYLRLIEKLIAAEEGAPSPELCRRIDELFRAREPQDPADWWKTPNDEETES